MEPKIQYSGTYFRCSRTWYIMRYYLALHFLFFVSTLSKWTLAQGPTSIYLKLVPGYSSLSSSVSSMTGQATSAVAVNLAARNWWLLQLLPVGPSWFSLLTLMQRRWLMNPCFKRHGDDSCPNRWLEKTELPKKKASLEIGGSGRSWHNCWSVISISH